MKIKENEKINKYLNLAREMKKLLNMNVEVKSIVIRSLGTVHNGKKTRGIGNQRKNQDPPDHRIVKIG